MKKLIKDANIIANIVVNTKVSQRGDLFLLIAKKLYILSQGFTGSLFKQAATTYGYKDAETKV